MSMFRTVPLPDIHVAYIDSTFMSPSYRQFPSQRRSAQCVGDLCDEWLRQHPDNHIQLHVSARFGYEYLFRSLWQRFAMPVHVNDADRYAMYQFIPDLDSCVTIDNSRTTRIHACAAAASTKRQRQCENISTRQRVRTIRVSAMVWSDWNDGIDLHVEIAPQVYRVCYSNHSSWQEIRDMLRLLQPQRVELNVMPDNKKKRTSMLNDLRDIMNEYAASSPAVVSNDASSETVPFECRLSGLNYRPMPVLDIAAEDGDDIVPVRLPKRRR